MNIICSVNQASLERGMVFAIIPSEQYKQDKKVIIYKLNLIFLNNEYQ